jgi:hypothetical protein
MSKYVYININRKVLDNPAGTAAAIFRISAAICVLIKALVRLFSRSKLTRLNTKIHKQRCLFRVTVMYVQGQVLQSAVLFRIDYSPLAQRLL